MIIRYTIKHLSTNKYIKRVYSIREVERLHFNIKYPSKEYKIIKREFILPSKKEKKKDAIMNILDEIVDMYFLGGNLNEIIDGAKELLLIPKRLSTAEQMFKNWR